MQKFFSRLGARSRVDGRDVLKTRKLQAGYVLFGPYCRLWPGRYAVTFRLEAEALFGGPCCHVDVVSIGGGVVAHREVTVADLRREGNAIVLLFDVPAVDRYEFRLRATGRAALTVDYRRPLKLLSSLPPDADVIVSPDAADLPPIFGAHYGDFDELASQGFTLRSRDAEGGPVMLVTSPGGITVAVQTFEDLTLVRELFFAAAYTLVTPFPSIVVDIGMNIGLTSLFFADMPQVQAVHAFEPFAHPFRRALANFQLNAHLQPKIDARPIGLADENASHTVLAATDQTIGTSIRGAAQGQPETIVVADAADQLAPIFDAAVAAGQHIIMKVDCEGSEFGIFARLDATGLLDMVSVVLCEWHKWWAVGRTQAELLAPLLRRGFVVVDRTDPTDLYAGQFYAIKARGGA